ncbi:Anti-adapter protein IraM (modular protein) [Klebsiella pneumoniae]|nr:Anti-adapter protein IraM (modular protein) [Klebsiella pneumoniae]
MIDGRYVFPYISARSRQQRERQYGEVSEWLKEHAWKVCIRQRIGGSNPPLTAIFEMRACTKVRALFFYILHRGGMRTPDRGSTTGAASWTDRARSKRAAPQGRAKRVNSPPHRHILRRARTQVRAFFSHVAPTGGDENPRPGFDN